jgi:hypothetical protein
MAAVFLLKCGPAVLCLLHPRDVPASEEFVLGERLVWQGAEQ